MSKNDELRILDNFVGCMTKAYRQRNCNYVVVRDILMNGTSTAGQGSCIAKCRDLEIDPYGYTLEKDGDGK